MKRTDLMGEYYFEKYMLDVAIATLEKGISTSKLNTYEFLEPVDAWGFPKHPGKTAILPPESDLLAEIRAFIEINRAFLLEPDSWFGTWIHPETGSYYLDIATSCVELEEARKEARERGSREGRKVLALYNSLHDLTVYL